METIKFIYKEQSIDFAPTGKENVKVNATQMAKVFGKQVESFTRNSTTKNFISECLKNENYRFLGINNESDLIDSSQNSGTFMHRVLALKFAAWLDPAFELWVFTTIDKVLNHYFHEQRDALVEKLSIKAQKEAKKKELLKKFPDVAEYFELEEKEKQAIYKRISSVKEQSKHIQIELFETILNETD